VLEISDDRVLTLKNVTINEPYFQGHCPRVRVMPGAADRGDGAGRRHPGMRRRGKHRPQRLLERQLVRRNSDDLGVTVDDQTRLRGARNFDSTQPHGAAQRVLQAPSGLGLRRQSRLASGSDHDAHVSELSYNIQASTSGL